MTPVAMTPRMNAIHLSASRVGRVESTSQNDMWCGVLLANSVERSDGRYRRRHKSAWRSSSSITRPDAIDRQRNRSDGREHCSPIGRR